MDKISENSSLVMKEKVTTTSVDKEIVLLDVEKGEYYGINELGAQIIKLSEENVSLKRIVEVLCKEYEKQESRVEKDVLVFAKEMESSGLAKIS